MTTATKAPTHLQAATRRWYSHVLADYDWSLTTKDLGRSRCYSGSASPEPPSSSGKSLSLGRPSFMGSTVDS